MTPLWLRNTEHPHTAEEFKKQYSKGIFLYYHPDQSTHPSIRSALSQAMPEYFPLLTQVTIVSFPADLGMQIGDTFQCYSATHSLLQSLLQDRQSVPMVKGDLFDYLPYIKTPWRGADYIQEGGCLIEVGGTHVLLSSVLSKGEYSYLQEHGIPLVPILHHDAGLNMFARTARIPHEEQWLYDGHVDLTATAFADQGGRIHSYIDSDLLSFSKKHGFVEPFFADAQPLDHEYAVKGGLNIKYMQTKHGNVALVPTKESLGPLAEDLEQSGYTLVEMGPDQVAHGGGVKCRSLVLNWR